jgi:chitinase
MPPINHIPSDVEAKSTAIFKWPSDKKLIVYHTNWSTYGRNYQVKDIPTEYISDINYAFYDLRQNTNGNYIPTTGDAWADTDQRFTDASKGLRPLDNWNTPEGAMYGNFGQFQKLRDSGAKFNLGLSIGGWTWSKNFSESLKDQQSREAFSNEVINLFKKYPIFNRLDLDWEYISPEGESYGLPDNITRKEDPENFAVFLKMMREKLDRNGMNHYEISMCSTADPKKLSILPIAAIVKYLDTVNIMTYDFADGAWGMTKSTHHTNIYPANDTPFSVHAAVQEFLKLGVPANKLVIGVAYYSRGFSNTSGMGMDSSGGSTDTSWERGIVDYKDLPRPGARELYDEEAQAAYSYDPVKNIVNSYDNPRSVKEKCDYVMKHGLKGIIVWEASGDSKNPDRCLSKVIFDNMSKAPVSTPVPAPRPVPVPSPTPAPSPVRKWTPFTRYEVRDEVIHQEVLYVCKTKHISPLAWDPESWTRTTVPSPTPVPVPSPTPAPAPVRKWTPFTRYEVRDEVIHQEVLYVCKTKHISPLAWDPEPWTRTTVPSPTPVPVPVQPKPTPVPVPVQPKPTPAPVQPKPTPAPVPVQPTDCPYLNNKIKKISITSPVENIHFEYY